MKESLALVLMVKILEIIQASGANETEAKCALRAAESMLPEADLQRKPTAVYHLPD